MAKLPSTGSSWFEFDPLPAIMANQTRINLVPAYACFLLIEFLETNVERQDVKVNVSLK